MRALLVVLLGLLAVATPALGQTDVSNAKAAITGAGGRYTLTVTNTGIRPIRCLKFRPSYPVELGTRPYGDFFDESPPDTTGWNMLTAEPNLHPGHTWRRVFWTRRPYPRGAGGWLSLNNPSYTDTCVFPGRTIRVIGPPAKR